VTDAADPSSPRKVRGRAKLNWLWLRNGSRPPRRDLHYFHAFAGEDFVEHESELGVAIAAEQAEGRDLVTEVLAWTGETAIPWQSRATARAGSRPLQDRFASLTRTQPPGMPSPDTLASHATSAKVLTRTRRFVGDRDLPAPGRVLPRGPQFPHKSGAGRDPTKFDFYAMDCYRHLGEDSMAHSLADSVIQASTDFDGTERAPMRIAEARITQGVVAAREGDLEHAVELGGQALSSERKSLPSLIMVSLDLTRVLNERYPQEQATAAYLEELSAVS
jgi:hypothetical protein